MAKFIFLLPIILLLGCNQEQVKKQEPDDEYVDGFEYTVVSEKQRLVELPPSPEFCDYGRFGIHYCHVLEDRLTGEQVRVYAIKGFQGLIGKVQLITYVERRVSYPSYVADAPGILKFNPQVILTTEPSEESTYQITLQRWLLAGTINDKEEVSFPLVLTGYEKQSIVCELEAKSCQLILEELQSEDYTALLVEVSAEDNKLSIEQLLCSAALDDYDQVCLNTN